MSNESKRAQPESFRARDLSVSLSCDDLQKSLAWYRDVMGFHAAQEYPGPDGAVRAVRLVAGDIRLLIGQDDGAKGRERKKGVGFSLNITTAQDIDELAAHIEERGGSLEDRPMDAPWGPRIFRVRDPDGVLITISSG
jgi:lactoylglutathione lyase